METWRRRFQHVQFVDQFNEFGRHKQRLQFPLEAVGQLVRWWKVWWCHHLRWMSQSEKFDDISQIQTDQNGSSGAWSSIAIAIGTCCVCFGHRCIRTTKYGIHGPAGSLGFWNTVSQFRWLFANSRETVSSAHVILRKFASSLAFFWGRRSVNK